MEYMTVFEIGQKGLNWTPIAGGVLFVLIGLATTIIRRKLTKRISIGSIFAIVFGIFVVVGIPGYQHMNTRYYQNILAQHQAHIVEGVIAQFHPMPPQGHDTERFIVDGVAFAYSDYFVTPAFNTTRSHGGPLHAGAYVRLYFTESREFSGQKAILRIQIRQ